MKYKISKEKVKQALITEKLKPRNFFSNLNFKEKDNGKCAVCAVGSILRTVKSKHFNAENASLVTGGLCNYWEISQAYQTDNFFSILSTEFESNARFHYYETDKEPPQSEDMRMFLLFLTEAFCPPVLEFEA